MHICTEDKYDVIIVGAGPAGLSAAKHCVERGMKTLLIEEHVSVGIPLQCAEGFAKPMFNILDVSPIGNRIDIVDIYSPNNERIHIRFFEPLFYVTDRKTLERTVAKNISKLGCDILIGCKATDVIKENNYVCGILAKINDENIHMKSDVVVCADGVASTIAKKAGIPVYTEPKKFDSGIQYQMVGVDIEKNIAEIYLRDYIPNGYSWIFPKDNGVANVGVGVNGEYGKNAQKILNKFISLDTRLSKGSIIEINAGIIPVDGPLKKRTGNGIIVIGDAAREVNPVTGGGIRFAITAGKLCAETLEKAIQKGDFSDRTLSQYEKKWNKQFRNVFRISLAIKKNINKKSPQWLDTLFRSIGEIDIPQHTGKMDILLFGIRRILPILIRYGLLDLKQHMFR